MKAHRSPTHERERDCLKTFWQCLGGWGMCMLWRPTAVMPDVFVYSCKRMRSDGCQIRPNNCRCFSRTTSVYLKMLGSLFIKCTALALSPSDIISLYATMTNEKQYGKKKLSTPALRRRLLEYSARQLSLSLLPYPRPLPPPCR